MKLLFVEPPSMTTVVSPRARRSRARASLRSRPWGDDLGDHRVEVGRDRVALGHPRVDPDAGSSGKAQQRDASRRGGEVAVGVFGVEAGLDGVATLGRPAGRIPAQLVETTAVRHVDLQLDEVGVGDDLRDGVLDLQPGVHLEEGEELLARVVEELDRAGPGVSDCDGQALGAGPDLGGLLGAQHR